MATRPDQSPDREPHRHPLCLRTAVANRSKDYTIRLDCPSCGGPVFVPSDSDREVVTCNFGTCGAELATRRTIDGVDLVERERDGAA